MHPEPSCPVRFGPYLLERRLAVGGMGELFVARRVEPTGRGGPAGQPCVIKRILPQLSQNPEFVARFQEETSIAAQLRHECILQMLEVGDCEGRHYLALEYVDGPDLRRLLSACWRSQRTLPAPVAVYVAYQILDALAYAHHLTDATGEPLGLIHRDISPSNVLISRQGDVKLIDFGLAKTRAAVVSTRPHTLFGKVAYLSPEQARADRVDPRSDIYSVGAILHELLTGERLVHADGTADLLELIANPSGPAPVSSLRPDLPQELDCVVARALALDPGQRYPTANEFRRALAPFLGRPLPEVRALTGAAVVDFIGAGDRPAADEARISQAAIQVEGSREVTERRARRRTPSQVHARFRSGIGTVYGARADDETWLCVDPMIEHSRSWSTSGSVSLAQPLNLQDLWRRIVLWMIAATIVMLVLFAGLR